MGYFEFAFPSGLCFLIGACLQAYVAVSDWNDAKVDEAARIATANGIIVADDDDFNAVAFHPKEVIYYAFNTLGPLFYVANAVVEILRVLAALRRHDRRRLRLSQVASEEDEEASDADTEEGEPEDVFRDDEHACDTTPLLRIAQSSSSMSTPLSSPTQTYAAVKINKDAESSSGTGNTSFDHTDDSGQSIAASSRTSSSGSSSSDSSDSATEEERRWELAASFCFGLGAILETYSTILDDVYDTDDDDDGTDTGVVLAILTSGSTLPWYMTYGFINVVSMHLYLLCGLVELYSQRESLKLSTFRNFFSREGSYDSYVIVGIIFFVSGTLLDCTMSFLYQNNIVTNLFVLAKCDLASALLWNICAPLYLMADLILLHEYYGDEDLNMYRSIWNLLTSWFSSWCCSCCRRGGRRRQSHRGHSHYDPVILDTTAVDGMIVEDSLRRNLLSDAFPISHQTTLEHGRSDSPDYTELP